MLIITFSAGYFLSEYNFFTTLNDDKAILQSNFELKKNNQQLLKEKYKLQNELNIELKTSALIKKKLSSLSLKITDLNTELNFYHGIINESSKSNTIFFQKIAIVAHSIPIGLVERLTKNNKSKKGKDSKINFSEFSSYKLDLSIVKKIKTKSYRSGSIKISLLNQKGKKFKQWKLLDSNSKEVKKLKLRFQSFKTMSAYILVNKQKTPSKIEISFIDALRGNIGVSQEFDWDFDQSDNSKNITYVGE
jgi:hypothetical protein